MKGFGRFHEQICREESPAKYIDCVSRAVDPAGLGGAVVTPHYLASTSAQRVLGKGGTAIDAAISAAAVLNVVYPQMTALGGDNFFLIYSANTKKVSVINASGRAAGCATPDFYLSKGLKAIPARGMLAANTVPGIVSGWEAAHKMSVSDMKSGITWAELLEDAIRYASEGFAVSPSLARWFAINTDTSDTQFRNLQRFDGFRKMFLKTDGSAYRFGEVMRLPDLAKTLETLAKEGPRSFYTGTLADKITSFLAKNGGMLTKEDFASHTADTVDPVRSSYRGYDTYNLPPNSQGFTASMILNMLETFDVARFGEGSADYVHAVVEATKLAFADRDRYLTDPMFAKIPMDELLSKETAKRYEAKIRMDKAATDGIKGDPAGDTVWLGVTDRYGNAVSLIQSIYHDFGSAIVAGDTGVLLQNRGSFFSLDEKHVNCIAPGKRTFHTLCAAMMLKNDKPALVYGTMGGEGQPQTQVAVATRVVDFGMTPADAVSAPRWLNGRTWGAASNDLKLESRFTPGVIDELKRRGHPVVVTNPYTDTMGHAGAILIDQDTGLMMPACDPRSDGGALVL